MPQRLGSFVLASGVAAISGFAALFGSAWGFGLKCDDSCGAPPPWRDDPNAWQWDAFGALALGGFAFSLIFLAAVLAGRRIAAGAALVSWSLLAVPFLTLLKDSGLASHEARGWVGLAVAAIAGAAAIALRRQ